MLKRLTIYGVFFVALFAWQPNTALAKSWAKAYGASLGAAAYSAINQTIDGGYIIAGEMDKEIGGPDFLVVKIDSNGVMHDPFGTNMAWKPWSEQFERANFVQQTSDEGYVVGGLSASYGPGVTNLNFLIVKLNSYWNMEWSNALGLSGSDALCYSGQQTSDNGYVMFGRFGLPNSPNVDFFIVKLNSSGTVDWAKTIGGTGWDCGLFVSQTSDNGYILSGNTDSYGAGNYDFLVIKLDSEGEVEWAKTFGGPSSESAHYAQQTLDGGYVIDGYTGSYGAGSSDILVIKLDPAGELEWAKTFGGYGSDFTNFVSAGQQTPDNGYILSGYTNSYGAGGYDALVMKLDSGGELEWAKTFGGTGNDYCHGVQQTLDGGYVLGGYTSSLGVAYYDFLVVKLEPDGSICGNCPSLQDCSPMTQSVSPIITSPPVVADSFSVEEEINTFMWGQWIDLTTTTICEGSNVCIEETEATPEFALLQNYPNPFSTSTTISFSATDLHRFSPLDSKHLTGQAQIKIYNVKGQMVRQLSIDNSQLNWEQSSIEWDGRDEIGKSLPSGIYLYRISAGNFTDTKKCVILK